MGRLFLLSLALPLLFVSPTQAAVIVFVTQLSGPAEAPPNASPGVGSSLVELDTTLHTLRVQASFSGLLGTITAAHIHSATAVPGTGTAGVATTVPTFPGFPSGVSSGVYDMTFNLTQASFYNPTFLNNNGGTAATAEAALTNGLLQGRAYLNLHTTQFPAGEIRGFLTPVPEPTSMLILGAGVPIIAVLARRRRSNA